MDNLFQRLVEGDLAQLSGVRIDTTITVHEALANELIVIVLRGNPQVEYCRIQIHVENRITLDVKSPLWPWPVKVKLKLFGSIDLSRSPTVRAFLENHVLLGKLGSLFNVLPKGIIFYEDQMAVDIGAFVKSREQKMLLDLIETAEISTAEHSISIDVKMRK